MWTMAKVKTDSHTFFSSKNDSINFDVKIKFFQKDDIRDFRLVQYLTMGQADFNQLMRLRNQSVITAENFGKGKDFSRVLLPTISKDMDEQVELAHNVIDVVDRANRKICVTLVGYNEKKQESSYVQVRIFDKKKEDEKF